jgi:hypothetical protein
MTQTDTSDVVRLPPRQHEPQRAPALPAAPDPVVDHKGAVDTRRIVPAPVNPSASGQPKKVIQRVVQPDPAAELRHQLRQQLTGNEFKIADLLLGRYEHRFTGTVPQAAQAAGLSLRQCERARSSLRKKGVITVRMNGKRANGGRHNSTMLLNANWPKQQRKRALTPHNDFNNSRLSALSARTGGATKVESSEKREEQKEISPPAEPAALSSPSSFSSRRQQQPGSLIKPVALDRGPGGGTTDMHPGGHAALCYRACLGVPTWKLDPGMFAPNCP